jgi:hypothetical protein
MALAQETGVDRLVAFHHDPNHNDSLLDRLFAEAAAARNWPFELIPAQEGSRLTLGRQPIRR